MPPLDEETALFMPITDPRISLTEATKILRQQDAIIAADPQPSPWWWAKWAAPKPPPIQRR
jgi:Cu/Ag efflux pump CusA